MLLPSLGAAGLQGRQAGPSRSLTPCLQAAPRPTQSMPRRRESANVQQPGPARGLRHRHVRRLVEAGGCQAPVQLRGIVSCPADGGSVLSGREGDDSPATARTNETSYTKICADVLGVSLPARILRNAGSGGRTLSSGSQQSAVAALHFDLRNEVPNFC